jgi:putative phage-type endonuclease
MPLTAEQREIRKKGVTGSEVSALVGLNPYKAPQQVWEEKLGLVEPDASLDDNPHIERGVFLEPALLAWTQKRVGYPVWANNTTYVNPRHPLIIATPDGFADKEPGSRQVVEVKAPSPRSYEDWGDPEVDPTSVPAYYLPQIMWEMAATDTKEALCSTLIGGQLRVYQIQRSQPFINTLLQRVEAFWECVFHEEPPPVDFTHQVERDWLKKHLANQKTDTMREFTGADAEPIEEDIKRFLEARAEEDAAKEKLDQVKSFLTFFVGDAAGFTTPEFKVTWKQAKESYKTDYKRFVSTIKRAFPDKLDVIDRILSECDYTAGGSRRFLVSERKDKS